MKTVGLFLLAGVVGLVSALPPLPKPPVLGNPACLAHINTLRSGACEPIAKKITKDTAAKISGASCAQLEALDIVSDVRKRMGGCGQGSAWLWRAMATRAHAAAAAFARHDTAAALTLPLSHPTRRLSQASEACCADAVKFVQDVR